MNPRLLSRVACALPLVLASACTASAPAPPDAHERELPEPDAPAAGALATPYSADAIRRSCSDGTELVFRVEQVGTTPVVVLMGFRAGDALGVEVHSAVTQADGTPLGETSSRSTWEELRDHAAFPAERTTIREASCRVPAGEFACQVYSLASEDGARVDRFWFADHAGPPVLMETEAGGEIVYRMELVERRGP